MASSMAEKESRTRSLHGMCPTSSPQERRDRGAAGQRLQMYSWVPPPPPLSPSAPCLLADKFSSFALDPGLTALSGGHGLVPLCLPAKLLPLLLLRKMMTTTTTTLTSDMLVQRSSLNCSGTRGLGLEKRWRWDWTSRRERKSRVCRVDDKLILFVSLQLATMSSGTGSASWRTCVRECVAASKGWWTVATKASPRYPTTSRSLPQRCKCTYKHHTIKTTVHYSLDLKLTRRQRLL